MLLFFYNVPIMLSSLPIIHSYCGHSITIQNGNPLSQSLATQDAEALLCRCRRLLCSHYAQYFRVPIMPETMHA